MIAAARSPRPCRGVDGLGQSVVIAVADAADRRHEVGLCQALGVVHGQVLHAPVTVMDQAVIRVGPARMDRLLKGTWTSPIFANGPALRRLAPKLQGPDVTLTYVTGRLFLDGTSIPAREA